MIQVFISNNDTLHLNILGLLKCFWTSDKLGYLIYSVSRKTGKDGCLYLLMSWGNKQMFLFSFCLSWLGYSSWEMESDLDCSTEVFFNSLFPVFPICSDSKFWKGCIIYVASHYRSTVETTRVEKFNSATSQELLFILAMGFVLREGKVAVKSATLFDVVPRRSVHLRVLQVKGFLPATTCTWHQSYKSESQRWL